MSQRFKGWLDSINVKHLPATTMYHHQTNGLIERFNRTLEQMIRTNTEDIADWDASLDKILSSYSTTPHRVTKKSPFAVLFGTAPRIPVDDLAGLDSQQTELNREEIRQGVKAKIEREASNAKLRYDEERAVGHRNMAPEPTDGGKLAPRFKGSYLAEKTDSPWNYNISDRNRNSKVVHVDQLKVCVNQEIPLAYDLRGRGRPTRIFYNANLRTGGGCRQPLMLNNGV